MNLLTETGWAGGPVGEPALAGEVTCDVAVVGGGVGGMTAALRLADSGADVVLLEAQTCGWGASSRNAGYVTNSIAADPALLALLFRRENSATAPVHNASTSAHISSEPSCAPHTAE